VTFALMLVATFISFFGVQAIVTARHQQHALGDPGALRVVFGAALYLTVLAIMTVAFGALIRNTAGGIALFVGLLFVLPGITAILPASIADRIVPYLPLNAGTGAASITFENQHHLSPWGGFALFCGYAALSVVLAAVGLLRRDA
jgi:ABC-2 type transport system permease protein